MFGLNLFKGLSLSFTETFSGFVSRDDENKLSFEEAEKAGIRHDELSIDLKIIIPDFLQFLDDPDHKGQLVGKIKFFSDPVGVEIRNGEFRLFKTESGTQLEYLFEFEDMLEDTAKFYGVKNVNEDPRLDSLESVTALFVEVTFPDTLYDTTRFKGKIYAKENDFLSLFSQIKVDTKDQGLIALVREAFLSFYATGRI